jgi:hypothetical protein
MFLAQSGDIGQNWILGRRPRVRHCLKPYLAISYFGRKKEIRRRPESGPQSPHLYR